MEDSTEPIKVSYLLESIAKRRWLLIVPFCLVMIIGITAAIKLPKIFEAQSLILVEPPRIPENYVNSTVSSEIENRINSITQHIVSRSSLENIIKQFNLFTEPEYQDMFIEDRFKDLRERISVQKITEETKNPRERETYAFTISFRGKDPKKVMGITNALTSYFINENLKLREDEAAGTSDFLEDELQGVRKNLEALEQKIKLFRESHMGGLPEQLETNLRMLDRLQQQLSAKQESLRDAKNRLVVLRNEFSDTSKFQQSYLAFLPKGRDESETDPYLKLQKLNQQLIELQNRYTDLYPDVKIVKKQIQDLEKKIAEGAFESQSGEKPGQPKAGNMNPALAEQLRIQSQQRDEIKLEIQKLESESAKLAEQIVNYQKLVEDTPKKEQELLLLKRDYENMKTTYDSIQERQQQANMALNMEKKQKGQQFRVIDPAAFPTTPVEPNMKMLFLLSLAAGLGIGGAIFYGLEYFDTSIKRKEDVELNFGIPLISMIPKIYQTKDLIWTKVNFAFTVVSIVFALALTAGFGLMAAMGVDEAVEAVNKFAML